MCFTSRVADPCCRSIVQIHIADPSCGASHPRLCTVLSFICVIHWSWYASRSCLPPEHELRTYMQVPFRLLTNFHKVQQRLVRELEKKFSGRDVVIIGQRRIMAPPKTGYALARPRSRSLTSVRAPLCAPAFKS
jgi:hypothetical protein